MPEKRQAREPLAEDPRGEPAIFRRLTVTPDRYDLFRIIELMLAQGHRVTVLGKDGVMQEGAFEALYPAWR